MSTRLLLVTVMRRMRPQIAFLQKGLFTSSVFWPIKFHADTFLQKTKICFLMTSWQPELKGIPFPSNFLFKLMSIFLQMVYRMFPYSSKLLAIKSCFCGHFMKNYPICSFFTYIRIFCKNTNAYNVYFWSSLPISFQIWISHSLDTRNKGFFMRKKVLLPFA